MNYQGIVIGIICLVIIGAFHPIVIKMEYYVGKKAWPFFLIAGLICLYISTLQRSILLSCILGILGVTFIWSIHEIIEQEERVKKGWFPKNPNKNL